MFFKFPVFLDTNIFCFISEKVNLYIRNIHFDDNPDIWKQHIFFCSRPGFSEVPVGFLVPFIPLLSFSMFALETVLNQWKAVLVALAL